MGVRLSEYYDIAKRKGGIPAQVKLAMKTCLTQRNVREMPDTPALLREFYEALCEIVRDTRDIPPPT